MIPFPKVHIAESTINRILNTLDGESHTLNPPMVAPTVPESQLQGAQIDAATTKPAVPAAPPDEAASNAGMLESSVLGGSPFNGALLG